MKFVFITLALALSTPLLAAENYWYDGGERRSLYVDPDRQAEISFTQSGAVTRQAGAEPVRRLSGIKLVHQGDATSSPRQTVETKGATLVQTTTQRVPVFRDQARGAIRVAAGNVILQLPEVWSAEQQSLWLAEQELTLISEIPELNLLVIASEPGYPTLELANRLAELPEVLSASPDWWQPVSRR